MEQDEQISSSALALNPKAHLNSAASNTSLQASKQQGCNTRLKTSTKSQPHHIPATRLLTTYSSLKPSYYLIPVQSILDDAKKGNTKGIFILSQKIRCVTIQIREGEITKKNGNKWLQVPDRHSRRACLRCENFQLPKLFGARNGSNARR